MAYQGIKETDANGRVKMFIFQHIDLKINKNTLGIWLFSSHQGLSMYRLGVGTCKNDLHSLGEKFPEPYCKGKIDRSVF